MRLEKRYELADKLAPHFEHLGAYDRRVSFGVVLNAPLKLNGKLTSLKDEFQEEVAFHIVNLVLCRIYSGKIIEVDLDEDDDDECCHCHGDDDDDIDKRVPF